MFSTVAALRPGNRFCCWTRALGRDPRHAALSAIGRRMPDGLVSRGETMAPAAVRRWDDEVGFKLSRWEWHSGARVAQRGRAGGQDGADGVKIEC